jgi:hypothetical protein
MIFTESGKVVGFAFEVSFFGEDFFDVYFAVFEF